MITCQKCGAQVDDGAKFCPSCGQAMNAEAAPPQEIPQPQAAAPPQEPQQYQPPAGPQVPPPPQYPPQAGYQQPQPGYQQTPPPQYQPQQGYQQPGYQGYQPRPPLSDAEANKTMAVLSYLWLLFLIPLCTGKHKVSQFVKYHLNQGIILSIFYTGYMIVANILSATIKVPRVVWYVEVMMTPPWLSTVLSLLYIPFAVLCVVGIVNAFNGKEKPLPVIGELFTIIQ